MNITIRKFEESDLSFVQERNFLLWLQLMYDADYKRENVFTAVNESNQILGVASLSFHASWYAMDMDILHKLKLDLVTLDESPDSTEISIRLMDRLKERLLSYKASYSNNELCICTWCEDSDISGMQFLLNQGFAMSAVIPVLKYDLTKDIRHYSLPQNIVIHEYPVNPESADALIAASAAGNNGLADSKAELLFRNGGGNFKLYVAEDHGKIVSSISLWDISESRGATENIFTIPEYRRQNIAKEIIATGLEVLKNRGFQIATLSVDGNNLPAMKLYLSMGYELMYNLMELRYIIK